MRVPRGGVLLLGAGVLLAAIAFGSRTLGVAGIGLVLAGVVARAWATFARSPARGVVEVQPSPATEGDEVSLGFDVLRVSGIPVGFSTVRAKLGRLGAVECRLGGHRRRAAGSVSLGPLPRGRYVVSDARLELGDPLGLESVSFPVELGGSVVVYPRLVELETLFSDSGRIGGDGRRLLLRRYAGFDFHSVREYEQGESLRRVHWPTTARRAQLMVKELEEAPRDAVAVLLDCDPAAAAGNAPDSSFDAAVRAAGSVLRAYAARGRRATLVTTGKEGTTVAAGTLSGDFDAALGTLAAAEADSPCSLDAMLRAARGAVSQAGELVIVTAVLGAATVDRLLDVASRRVVSVVWIDAPSFAGRPTRAATGVLRLSGAGIPVAVVRRSDDLRAALSLPLVQARALG